MADERPFVVQGEMLKQVSQSLLEMKKMARSLENSALALEPLANGETVKLLQTVGEISKQADSYVTTIYRAIAREAAQS